MTSIVLVNAMYLCARWASPFDASETRTAPFFIDGGDTKVSMMQTTGHFKLAGEDDVSAVELDFAAGTNVSMLVVLPKHRDVLPKFASSFDLAQLGRIRARLQPTAVRVALPRFNIEPAESVSLKAALRDMGMPLAFEPKADFSAMGHGPEEWTVFIGDVFHKAFVRVDEQGTEAAAATAVAMGYGGFGGKPVPVAEFIADHPFLFFILDRASGAILFMGHVENPAG